MGRRSIAIGSIAFVALGVGAILLQTLPFLLLFVCVTAALSAKAVLSPGRRAFPALMAICLIVCVYRVSFFHYIDQEMLSDLHFEYLRRVELHQLPIVEYPEPHPIFEAQPLSYLTLHFLSGLAGLDPVLAAKSLRVLWGVMDLVLIFLLARAITGSRRTAVVAALLFATSFTEFWDSCGTQFKQCSGQVFWYALLVIYFHALSRGTFTKRTWIAMAVAWFGAVLGHKLFLFTGPELLSVALYAQWRRQVNPESPRPGTLRLVLTTLTVPMATLAALASPATWGILGLRKEDAMFAQLGGNAERLTGVGPFAWMGQMLAFASLLVVISAAHTALRSRSPQMRQWCQAARIAIIGLSLNAAYFFGIPLESGRASQLVWPFVCIAVAQILISALRKYTRTLSPPLLVGACWLWMAGNLSRVANDPENMAIKHSFGLDLWELGASVFGPVFQHRGILVEAAAVTASVVVLIALGLPAVRWTASIVRCDPLTKRLWRWSAPLWGLLTLTLGGSTALVLVLLGTLRLYHALFVGLLFAIVYAVAAWLAADTCAGVRRAPVLEDGHVPGA